MPIPARCPVTGGRTCYRAGCHHYRAAGEPPRRAVRTLALFAGARADQRRPAVGRRCPGAGRRGWDRKDAPLRCRWPPAW